MNLNSHKALYFDRGGMVLAFFSAAEIHNLVKTGVIEKNLTDSIENINQTAYESVNDVSNSTGRSYPCTQMLTAEH